MKPNFLLNLFCPIGRPKSQTLREQSPRTGIWQPGQRRDRLGVIEQDIRTLMRKLAEAQAAGPENDKRSADHLKRLLLSLLDILDAFGRVFESVNAKKDACTPQMNIWVGNFRTVYRLLNRTLMEQGITPLENLDQGFDPHWHEVERTIYDPSRTEGTIVEEVKKGYLWQGKELLRRAKVVVVTHKPSESEGNGNATDGGPPKASSHPERS